ncbi:MAG: hypothetical protein H0U05_03740, partial [Actinobacteria bacterium]|nr:hypothetical protein [Actinomycetota bacterium]
MSEAPLERTETGARPAVEGWFVLNVRHAQWFESELGFYTQFEGETARFPELGIGLGILRPGEPSAMYHGEDAQENFLCPLGRVPAPDRRRGAATHSLGLRPLPSLDRARLRR